MNLIKYIVLALVMATACSYAQVAVIAHKSVSESSINNSKLADIYSLKAKSWSNGSAIVRVTLKSDDGTSAKFFGAIGKSLADMKKVWMKLQLTGEGQAPEAMGSEDEVVNKVASTPGAIGYVSAGKVNDKVKVLMTIN
jgi:ABC-type phosphate transport system substrate-binding protein